MPRQTPGYGEFVGASGPFEPVSDSRVDARSRYLRAIRAVPIEVRDVVVVCCLGEPVGRGLPMERLRSGLDALADHCAEEFRRQLTAR